MMDRAQFFKRGAAGAAAALAGPGVVLTAAGSARAAAPAPVGDDLGFLQFGSVAEKLCVALYGEMRKADGWSAAQRAELVAIRKADLAHLEAIDAALAADAPGPNDFEIVLPGSVARSRAAGLRLAARVERAVTGIYLSGVANAEDPGTRRLLGELLISDTQHLQRARVLAGRPASYVVAPAKVTLEAAAETIDRYVRTPTAPVVP